MHGDNLRDLCAASLLDSHLGYVNRFKIDVTFSVLLFLLWIYDCVLENLELRTGEPGSRFTMHASTFSNKVSGFELAMQSHNSFAIFCYLTR